MRTYHRSLTSRKAMHASWDFRLLDIAISKNALLVSEEKGKARNCRVSKIQLQRQNLLKDEKSAHSRTRFTALSASGRLRETTSTQIFTSERSYSHLLKLVAEYQRLAHNPQYCVKQPLAR
jgi:hypothetical protein